MHQLSNVTYAFKACVDGALNQTCSSSCLAVLNTVSLLLVLKIDLNDVMCVCVSSCRCNGQSWIEHLFNSFHRLLGIAPEPYTSRHLASYFSARICTRCHLNPCNSTIAAPLQHAVNGSTPSSVGHTDSYSVSHASLAYTVVPGGLPLCGCCFAPDNLHSAALLTSCSCRRCHASVRGCPHLYGADCQGQPKLYR